MRNYDKFGFCLDANWRRVDGLTSEQADGLLAKAGAAGLTRYAEPDQHPAGLFRFHVFASDAEAFGIGLAPALPDVGG